MRMVKAASCPLVENRTGKKGRGIGPLRLEEHSLFSRPIFKSLFCVLPFQTLVGTNTQF